MKKAFLLVLLLLLGSVAALAKDKDKKKDSSKATPKAELFGGYSYLRVNPSATNAQGWEASLNYNLNHWFGVKADFDGHYCCSGQKLHNFMFGPQFSYRMSKATFFAHGLGGVSHGNATGFSDTVAVWAVGGGVDWNVGKTWAIRLGQADYVSTHYGGVFQHDFRGSTGLVWRIGGGPPPPPASCSVSVEPMQVTDGDTVQVHVTPVPNTFPKNHVLSYSWSAEKASGKEAMGTINTEGMAPPGKGPVGYTLTAQVTDNKKATANCSASFTVNPKPRRPELSCSANPTEVNSGEKSTITCPCSSPDGVGVSVTHSVDKGTLSSTSGETVDLDTVGLAPKVQEVVKDTARCKDARGLEADPATATVTVDPVKIIIKVIDLGGCGFDDKINKAKPAYVNNKCKRPMLDDVVALRLQRDADAKLVIVGYAGPKEAGGKKLAAQRAVNAKNYLTKEKGIDPGRIEVRTGMDGGKRAEFFLVPAGATFSEPNTEVVMEKAPMMKKAPMKKKAGK